MKKSLIQRIAALVIVVAFLFVAVSIYKFNHPRIVMYSGQYHYTMADDQEIYRARFPCFWIEENYTYRYHSFRPAVFDELNAFSGSELVSAKIEAYKWHLNADYEIALEGDEIVFRLMGYGKLPDGRLEAFDETVRSKYFPFEDQTAGDWRPPLKEGESPMPEPLNDPSFVFQPRED